MSKARFDVVGKLGSGAYAVVLKARDSERDEVVALKKITNIPQNQQELAVLLQEAIILKAACHPNIVRLMDAYQSSSGRVYLVFEHVDKTIARELLFRPQGLPLKQVKLVMWQVLQAVSFLHEQGILHRDLKPENILISSQGIVKICDFGFARFTEDLTGGDSNSYAITRWYRAPEVLIYIGEAGRLPSTHDPYSPAVDIWALGCVMASLATGQALMPGVDRADQLRLIATLVGPLTPGQLAAVAADAKLSTSFKPPSESEMGQLQQRLKLLPAEAIQVIRECLQVDPLKRASADQLLSMPFFADVEVPLELGEQLKAVKEQAASCQEDKDCLASNLNSRRSRASAQLASEFLPGSLRSALMGKSPVPVPPALVPPANQAPTQHTVGCLDVPKAASSCSQSRGIGVAAASVPEVKAESVSRPAVRQLLMASPVYRPLLSEMFGARRGPPNKMPDRQGDAPPPAPPACLPSAPPGIHLKRCGSVAASGYEEDGVTIPHGTWSMYSTHTGHSAAAPVPIPLHRYSSTTSVLWSPRDMNHLDIGSAETSSHSRLPLEPPGVVQGVMGSMGFGLEDLHLCEVLQQDEAAAEPGCFSGVVVVME